MQPGTLLGPYEVAAQIGSGGMGEVYRARDTRLGRDVAIKVLPPEFATDPGRLRRFEQEARAVAALSHPNVLAVYDVGTHEGAPYFVTELLEGENLRDRLRIRGLTVRKAVEIAVQIAQGLTAAHEKGIVHRDLKPANVFITTDGHVKILDFGLAKVAHPEVKPDPYGATVTSASSTEAGAVLGTMGYTSPEQLRGERADARSDIFSFGCVLYEMLSRCPPFLKATGADTVSAVLLEEPPGLDSNGSKLPPGLRQIVRRCLEKRPQERFSTVHDLALALEAAGGDSAIPAQRTGRRRSFPRIWVVPAVVVASVAVVIAVWLIRTSVSDVLPASHARQVTGQLNMTGRPSISPSGNEITYATKENGKSTIWITDIRGGKPLRLTTTATESSDPTWFPDGSTIAFTSQEGLATSIWKIPRFGGTPMLLVPGAEQAALSPEGTRIAFARPAEEGLLRIWVAKLGSLADARKITGAVDGLFDHESPAWSPDGRTICYSDIRDLWLVPAEGGKTHPLIEDDFVNNQPVWSADGRFVYFTSTREGTLALWRVPARGGQPIRVTDGTGSEQLPSLSRDGRRLAFASRHLSGGIALADLRTGRIALVQEGSYSWLPAIAPDRGALVFVSKLAGAVTLRSVPLRDNAPAGESVLLTDQPGVLSSPAFSPDGRWVAYCRVVEGQREVWVVPVGGGLPVNFSGHPGQDAQPVWSPDSTEIAFMSNRGGAYQIWVAPFANGHRVGEPRRVTLNGGTACFPSWSPDGKTLAYVLVTEGKREVWAAPADGSGPSRRLTSNAQACCLRWIGTSGEILVSGYWGQRSPALRSLSPDTGELRPFALPGSLTLDRKAVDFDLSPDGSLLALFVGDTVSTIWVREAEKGLS